MKKKLLCLVLTMCVLAGIICMPVNASAEGAGNTELAKLLQTMTNADADGDGAYTTSDTRLILSVVARIAKCPQGKNFDLNGDGSVDLRDVNYSLRIATKTVTFGTELFDLTNAALNSVKKDLPGFTYNNTVHCKSCLVTTNLDLSELSLIERAAFKAFSSDLIVTDKPLYDYFKGMEKVIPEEDKANFQAQLEDAKRITEPKNTKAYVGAGKANSHTIYFPLSRKNYTSALTSSDISSIGLFEENERNAYIIRIKLDKKSYLSNSAFLKALEDGTFTYAKAFNNVPDASSLGDSTLKKLNVNDGIIDVYIDKTTNALVAVNYSFNYEIHFSRIESQKVNDKDVEFSMLTKQKFYITENYDIGKNTLEVVS